MPSLRSRLFAATSIATFALLAGPISSRAEDAGITGAVNTDVVGTPPGGSTSNLAVGRTVVRNEHIVSDDAGLAQLLFLDQTTLTVGPNSDIMIDEFVYDPATKEGQLLMEASVGVFRLIGGETATSGGINVVTPFATMGIRGSNIVIQIAPNGTTRVTCNYCDSVQIQLLNSPDKLVTIFGSDRFRTIEIGPDGFTAPFELTPEQTAQLQTLLTSQPGQNGGAANVPSEPQVSEVVNGDGNSNNPPPVNDPNAPPKVQTGYNDQVVPNPQEQTEGAQDENEQQAEDQGGHGGETPPLLFTGGSFVSTPLFTAFAEGDDGWSGDLDDPEHTESIVSATLSGDELILTLASGRVFELPYRAGTFAIEGEGLSGEGFVSPGGQFFSYQIFDDEAGRASLLFGGQEISPAQTEFDRFMAWDLQPDLLENGPAPFLRSGFAGGIDPEKVVTSPLYFVAFQQNGDTHRGTYGVASLGFDGTGSSQTSLLSVSLFDGNAPTEGDEIPAIDGTTRSFSSIGMGENTTATRIATGDLGTLSDGSGNAFFGGEDGVYFVLGSGKYRSGNDSDVLYDSSTADGGESAVAYEPIHVATPSSEPLPADFGQDRPDVMTRHGYAAGAADLGNGQGYVGLVGSAGIFRGEGTRADFFLDTVETQNSDSTFDTVSLRFGNAMFIDRNRIMMQESGATFDTTFNGDTVSAGFVSYDLVRQPGDILPGGAVACDCAFMEWGFWAYDARNSEENIAAIVPIGTWVTGNQTVDYNDLPTDRTASYEGHAIANILNTTDGVTSSYMASGSLTMQVDFQDRDLQGSITNLDNRNYTFGADYTGFSDGIPGYHATGQSSDSEIDISLNGGFFAGPAGGQQGVGGSFTLQPNELSELDYVGTGTFMGEEVPQ